MIEQLSASARKLISSLSQVKHRREHGLFTAEGTKCLAELAGHFPCRMIAATPAWIEANAGSFRGIPMLRATRADMERISCMSTAADAVGVFEIPDMEQPLWHPGELMVALDGVRDPGNLGTIIRSCDWFGVSSVVCSADTVDVYNQKVVQSTMGALARVKVSYCDLPRWLAAQKGAEVYGTFLEGDDIYDAGFHGDGIVVMGNEGTGVCAETASMVSRKLFIPPYPVGRQHVESLNVAMATTVVLAEFRRRVR